MLDFEGDVLQSPKSAWFLVLGAWFVLSGLRSLLFALCSTPQLPEGVGEGAAQAVPEVVGVGAAGADAVQLGKVLDANYGGACKVLGVRFEVLGVRGRGEGAWCLIRSAWCFATNQELSTTN